MEESANKFLDENNIGYDAKIKFENTEIPRKEYNGIVLPKGNYKSIRVMLGEGGGENWWCVAYPPLCFVGEDNGTNNVCYKSKLYELINNFFGR